MHDTTVANERSDIGQQKALFKHCALCVAKIDPGDLTRAWDGKILSRGST